MRYVVPPFIVDISLHFYLMGLCSLRNSSLQDTWQCRRRWIHAHQIYHVNTMDSGSRDHHQSSALKHVLCDAFDNSPGDTWTHEEAPIFIGREKQAEGMGRIVRSWEDMWTHQERPILIGQEKLRENMDRIVGHASIAFAQSDGSNLIAKRMVHISRNISLYISMYSLFLLNF